MNRTTNTVWNKLKSHHNINLEKYFSEIKKVFETYVGIFVKVPVACLDLSEDAALDVIVQQHRGSLLADPDFLFPLRYRTVEIFLGRAVLAARAVT